MFRPICFGSDLAADFGASQKFPARTGQKADVQLNRLDPFGWENVLVIFLRDHQIEIRSLQKERCETFVFSWIQDIYLSTTFDPPKVLDNHHCVCVIVPLAGSQGLCSQIEIKWNHS